jgi:hypothetical protein
MSNPPSEDTYRSLQLVPPPFDPARARSRAVIYVHRHLGTTARKLTGTESVGRRKQLPQSHAAGYSDAAEGELRAVADSYR